MAEKISAADVNTAALLEELKLWVAIETPTHDSDAINRLADRVEALARSAGLIVDRRPGSMGFGDILLVKTPHLNGSNEKSVLLLAHLDTVHAHGVIDEQLPLRQDGDKLFGPGIYDMKSGALMALEAMKLVVAAGCRRHIELLFVPDEEVGSPSSQSIIEECARNAAFTLVVEPARDGGKIVVARKGVGMYDIVVRGRASHAGTNPKDGRSAIRSAAKLVLALESLNNEARGITVTVGMINGGTGRNTVPAECRITVDVRVLDLDAAQEVTSIIEAMRPSDDDIHFEISGGMSRPPFAQSDKGRELFGSARDIAEELGIVLEGVETGGGSDGNFTAALGIPTLDGLGADGAGAHTFGEFIFVSSLAPRTALLANLLLIDGPSTNAGP